MIPNSELEKNTESQDDLVIMKERVTRCLEDNDILSKVTEDFKLTFSMLIGDIDKASIVAEYVIESLKEDKSLQEIEDKILNYFQEYKVIENDKNKNLVEILEERLKGRADLIFEQIKPYLEDVNGYVLDFGAGDGQVSQKIKDELDLDVSACDVRDYKLDNVEVPFLSIGDKSRLEVEDDYFSTIVITNVLHHEKNNQDIIKELYRLLKPGGKLIVIETVPVGKSEKEIENDRERTFMNDYLYNRLFHNANVPVPGTYETPAGWIKRFEDAGFKLQHSENLGVDQPTIQDTHHLIVFDKMS